MSQKRHGANGLFPVLGEAWRRASMRLRFLLAAFRLYPTFALVLHHLFGEGDSFSLYKEVTHERRQDTNCTRP